MKTIFVPIILAALLAAALPAPAAPPDLTALFPDLEGWRRDGAAATFTADTLFEHINGAAENFLACGFELLAVQDYAGPGGRTLSAEIYFHGTAENAFAIYSSERPLAGDYLELGGEAYAEEGVLNFISDAYYVKLIGFDLKPGEEGILRAMAERIVAAIGGRNALPALLDAFPAAGRLPRSERYIVSNFLGHAFLNRAYAVDYERQGKRFKLFLLAPADPGALLRRWASLDKGFAGEVAPGKLTIADPYNGPVQVRWQDGRILGGVGDDAEIGALLDEMARKTKN